MSGHDLLALRFRQAAQPLEPDGVYAEAGVALRVARQLLNAPVERMRGLRGCTLKDALIVLGPLELLPWEDGVIFVAACPAAPALLLPTYCEPELPAELLQRSLSSPEQQPPYLLLPERRRVIALGRAAAFDAVALQSWLATHSGHASRASKPP